VEGEPAEQPGAGGLGPGVDVAGVEQVVRAGSDLGEAVRTARGQRRGRAAGEHERVVGGVPRRPRRGERVEHGREGGRIDPGRPADEGRRRGRARPFH